MAAPRYHAFSRLQLVLGDAAQSTSSLEKVIELRACDNGAEVWISDRIAGDTDGPACRLDARFVGHMGTRRVIDLLDAIERSGVYELATCASECGDASWVSLSVHGDNVQRTVVERAPAGETVVAAVVRSIREAVARAQERALAIAG